MEKHSGTIIRKPFAKFSDSIKASDLKAISFDCYGTLIDIRTDMTPPDHPVWRTLAMFAYYHTGVRRLPEEFCGKFFEYKELEKQAGDSRAEGEPFEIEELNVYRKLFVGADEQIIRTAAEIFRASTTNPKTFKLFRGTKEFMKAAKQAGLRLFMTSNSQNCYTVPEFKALGIYDLFDGHMEEGISSSTFFRKPSKKFFQMMLDNLEVQPHEVLNIGNYLPDDITPAKALGIHTCLLNSERQDVNTPEEPDFFFDYPNESDDLPDEYYPFFRLKKHLFG